MLLKWTGPGYFRDQNGYPAFWLDRDEVIDRAIDFAGYLDGDTISTAETHAEGITIDSTSNTTTSVTVWLSALARRRAHYTITINTAGGRTVQQMVRVYMRDHA